MRVSLDTNVLVSAFTTRGICADVLGVVLAEHELVLGERILAELSRVLREKMRMPEDSVVEADAFLRHEATVISTGATVDVPIRDPDDLEVLAQAVEGLVDLLVTGDRDLLDVADRLPVEVLSPRGFWEKLHE